MMISTTMIQAVIFDFNGVLLDDESVHFDLFREVLAQEGVTITERDYQEVYLGLDDRGCFETALRDAGQTADSNRLGELIARKARRYVEVAEQGLRFFPFAAETLAAVAARWPVAICSGALRAEIESALVRLGRRDQVAVIISAEDTRNCKPHPEGYQLALTALRENVRASGLVSNGQTLDAGNCLVVEDSLAGIASAKGAGMRAVGITHTYPVEQLLEAGADAIIHNLETFTPEWIERQFP